MIDFESLEMSDEGKKHLAVFVAYFGEIAEMESKRMKRCGILPDEPGPHLVMPTRLTGLDLIQVTLMTEVMLNMGHAGVLLEVVFGETHEKDGVCYGRNHLGHEVTVEFFEIWLRTQIARDKLMFYKLGLFKPLSKKEINLKTGKFVLDEREQIYALAQLEQSRKHPGFISQVKIEAGKMDPVFFQRMGQLLKKPGKIQEELRGDNLQLFLLDYWAFEGKDRKGELIPSLCYYSDKAIAMMADYFLKMNTNTWGNVRKTWERLGLMRSEKPPIKTVAFCNGKMQITEYKSRLG